MLFAPSHFIFANEKAKGDPMKRLASRYRTPPVRRSICLGETANPLVIEFARPFADLFSNEVEHGIRTAVAPGDELRRGFGRIFSQRDTGNRKEFGYRKRHF